MHFRAATADPTDLDRALAYPADGPVPALTPEKIREEFAAHQMRPEWTWFAEDENGEVLARALWWGRADSERPAVLDCLQVRAGVADPAAVAAGLLAAGHEAFGKLPDYNISLPRDWRTSPDGLADAVAWRQKAAAEAGLVREIERLRFEWTPAAGTAEPTGRLVFREGTDEEFLDAFVRLSQGSLDVHTQSELRTMDAEALARDDIEFYTD
ncbi:hypothetical protein ABT024_23345 [Streptomyces sp. NPDC002812]|uniref:hypothetical protein n=1 Tax=Streptomyces sp. NPDC002812 TaxID=3154434 RepID=UPI0033287830